MLDAAIFYAQKAEQMPSELPQMPAKFALCTMHRAENTDNFERLSAFVEHLNALHRQVLTVVVPLHPRTKKKLIEHGLELKVNTVDPVGYFNMIRLLKTCEVVLTDSGGLQKEAFFFNKQCLTMREQTEWTELVQEGYNQLVFPDTDLCSTVKQVLSKTTDFDKDLYGKGNAGEEIVDRIVTFCG